MDKNKSRSDLLKAGRKKLQQFREKKDGKGGSSSHAKSSKKSSKSEQHQSDTDATTSAAKSTVSSFPEVEDESNVDSDLLVVDSDSMENSLAPETDVASVDLSSVIMPEEGIVDASLAHDTELPPLQSRVGDADSKNKESTQIVDTEELRATPSATLGVPVLEGETKHSDNSGITNLTALSASVDTAEEVAEMDTVNGKEREELLPSKNVIPDASLIQARGDQVTDEANDLGLKKFDGSGEPDHEGDGMLVLSDLGGSAATLHEADATPATSHQVENQLKDAVAGFPDEEKSGIPFVNYGNDQKEGAQVDAENKMVTEMCNQQYIPEDSLLTRSKAQERSLETEMESSKGPVSNAELGNSGLILQEYCHPDSFEKLKEELYLTKFGKDIFHLQLEEMSNMQMKFDHQQHQLVGEISLLRASLNEDQEKKECLAEELAHCRSELQAAASRRGELENQVHSLKAEAHEFSSRAHELQISLESSQGDLSNLSVELADCKGLVTTLQVENEKLKGTVALMTDDGNKLVEEKEYCLHENEKLSLELADCKSILASLQIENSNLSGTLTSVTEERKKLEEEKESHACEYARISGELIDFKGLVSALQVENANINQSLSLTTEERKKIEEDKEYFIRENERLSNELLVLRKKFPSDSEEHTRDGRISLLVLEKPSSDDAHTLVVFKAHLEEVEKILQNLEEAIEGMHSEATSFNRSSGKIAAPGVSKLIQAFESKVQHDELEAEDQSLTEGQLLADPFMLIKEQTGKLRTVLQQLRLDAENVKGERDAEEGFKVAATELKVENEALKKNCDNLEATNIEIGVLYEAVKQHACEVEAKNKELAVQIEALKREDVSLQEEYVELGEKVNEYKSRANELLSQLHDLQRSSDEKTSVMEYQLESLQKEATERALTLEQEWETTIAQMIEMKGRLDECIARVSVSAISTRTDDGLDVNSCMAASVNTTIKVIEALQEKLEAALEDLETVHGSYKEVHEKFNDLVRKNESASVTLHQIYGDLRKLLIDSHGSVDELEMNIQASELADPFDYANYKTLVEQLENLLGERLQLQSLNNKLNSELMSRTDDIEELNRRCLSLNVILKLAEDVKGVVNLQNSETDSDITPASHLESLVSLLVQKYIEASEQVSASRKLFSNAIQKLIEDVEGAVNLENTEPDLDITPALHLELLVSALVQKYKEASERVSSSREEFSNAIQKLGDIEGVVFLENTGADLNITPALRLELLVSSLVQKYKEASDRVSSSTEEFSNTIQKLIGDIEGVVNLHNSESNSDITPALRLELLVSSLVQKYKETVEQVSSSTDEFSNTIRKLIGDIEGVVEDTVTNSDITPALRLESLVSSLVQKSKGASVRVCSSNEEFGSKAMELTELQENIQQLNALNLKHENEILSLKESLGQAEEALTVAHSELQAKASELEQSDQRVSSIREKLSIAVGKGKALVVQRDNLKQSLAETSKELERCSQELQLKDARLHELETKLKSYMEAGEHVEALESELSYIRNSATALRESFLLKDSVLQRIEEILEDLDLPEQFHSRGIIEKVDWLARSATGNSLSVTEWDQKSSVGGSYSDTGFVVTDAWKEDAPPSSSSGDDLRRKYEELQNKFYGLAEQTEMLEQSLMERNHVVQKWEELLESINMPSHLHSVEPEGRIEWLGTALMEADHDRNSLLQKIDKLENYCGLVTADLEESQKRIYELEADLQAVIHEREHISERLEILISDQERILAKAVHFEHENGKLQSEVTCLQEKLAEKVGSEERIQIIEVELHKLEGLVNDALQDPDATDLVSGECGTECLEALVRKLIEHYSALSMVKPELGSAVDGIQTTEADANLDESESRDVIITEKPDVAVLRKDLEEAMHNLMQVKEERDVYMEKQQSLICEVEALDRKRDELQAQLIQEEQKSASLREKLNAAVRKGKSLVQQRDSLKQTLEEMNNEVDQLKSEISHRENTLADNEQKIRDLSAFPEMVEALESERLFLRNRLTETKHALQEREHILNSTINALGDIDVGGEVTIDDPVEKLKQIGKLLHDLHAYLASSEQESRKSGRAAELLLAELNEVQERNDYLQEELAKTGDELVEISKERDVAEAAKFEALSRLEKLSTVYSENGKLQSEVTGLQEKLAEKVGNEERIQCIEAELHTLESLVSDALQDPDAKELVSGECGTKGLEALVRKLIEHYSALSMGKPELGSEVDGIQTSEANANLDESGSGDMIITEKPDVAVLKKDLEEAMLNLMHVKEERDVYMEKQQSLICEIEALNRKKEELQEQLTKEEQKSASLREKLNAAVRKGKSLVQQRDSLKQSLEEMNTEVDRLKSEISHRENTLADNEQKIRDLSAYPEMVEALESEKWFLRNRLTETEHALQEREHILNSTINALGEIDVGGEVTIDDPVEKLKQIGKLLHDMHSYLASSKQESGKSRRAAELLLAELNEVQERNDYLQEDLAKAGDELAEISKERDVAETAKFEALSRLEKLSTVYSEGKQKKYYELMVLKTSVKELKKGFSDVNNLLADVFSKDLEFLHNLEAHMESCLKQRDTTDVVGMPILIAYSGITSSNSENKNLLSTDSWSGLDVPDHLDDSAIVEVCSFVKVSLQELKMDIGVLKEKLHKHPILLQERASNLSKVMEILRGEMNLQKKSLETLKRDFMRVESVEKEKDMEIVVLRRNIALLYEACTDSIMEIVDKKAELVGNNSAASERGMSLNPVIHGELPSGGQTHFNSEEYIKAIADRLSSTLKDFAVTKTKNVEGNLKEMKTTIADLQRELQEKDIQKDRICSELVSQIKGAEAAAQSYIQDLQSEKARVYGMEQQLKAMEEERSLLDQRLKELQDEQATFIELHNRVKSLSDVLPAKDQEIEALMQALDEEEIQMAELKNRIEELEKVLQQKNLDLQNLEASRGKIAKRLSVTVNKFDELHHLSESLLAEVEKLQSQLQDRDAEISFLRQEVTRCTNEVLVASQISNKRDSDEIQEILSWVDTMISRTGLHDLHLDDNESSQVQCMELLQKKISVIISEFVDQRVAAQSRDAMLQVERSKVQELTRREEVLRNSLREKESQINMLEDVGDSGQENSLTSKILEVEPVINKWTVPGSSTASQVRSLRKVNNDQVAIAIDTEPNSSSLEDEDDDKVHGFKSLTTSRIVPRFTRPVTDMIDGLWVSCDRALMRQPALRLSIIVYWAVLHTLLASFVF